MEQGIPQPRSKQHRLWLYGAALAVLIGSLLLFKFNVLLYLFLATLITFVGGLPAYLHYWKRGLALEATLLVGAMIAGGLAGVAWEQLS